jgi:hypothetical protein
LLHLGAEWTAYRAGKQQADLLEQAADLVLQIAANADQAGTGNEQGTDGLAIIALDPDFAIYPESEKICSASP